MATSSSGNFANISQVVDLAQEAFAWPVPGPRPPRRRSPPAPKKP